MPLQERTHVGLLLGIAQTFAWASTYYLPAILATPMATDLGLSPPTVFAAFSLALIVAAIAGPRAGRAIDQWGGRRVLLLTCPVFTLGLALLSQATGVVTLCLAWAILGIGVAFGLYEAAFATVVRRYGHGARNVITGITLIAGFASTLSWPVSTLLEAQWGWRTTCLLWASVHVLICLPLYLRLPHDPAPAPTAPAQAAAEANPLHTLGPTSTVQPVSHATHTTRATTRKRPDRRSVLLAFFFASTGFISASMGAHFPALLQACGIGLAMSVSIGMLIGPAQVAARILEYGLLRKMHPLLNARLSTTLNPIGAGLLLLLGPPGAIAFGLLYGAGNGMLTIAKGTLPLAIFGAQGYGQRQGWLMAPARVVQALAPWLFGLAIAQWQSHALLLSAGLGVLAFVALLFLSHEADATA